MIRLKELLRSILSVAADVIGLHLALGQVTRWRSGTRVLGLALGWTMAEGIVARLIPLWIMAGPRVLHFDWAPLASAVEANISLLSACGLCGLVYAAGRGARSPLLLGGLG